MYYVCLVVAIRYWFEVLDYTFSAANIRVVDPVREFGSPGLGNVAWKERVDGWKMKQEKNVVPMSTGQANSERGAGDNRDIDASTDVLVDDSLLYVPSWLKYRLLGALSDFIEALFFVIVGTL